MSGHNHNMEYLVSKKFSEGNEYEMQNTTDLCLNPVIICDGVNVDCWDKNISCKNSNVTCADGPTYDDDNDEKGIIREMKNATYKKGEELHQVIMGASGANLDVLCRDMESPMAEVVFALVDYGFAEITITEEEFQIMFIHANSSEVVFESRIFA